MKARIETLLKTKIGTSFAHSEKADGLKKSFKFFKLTTYGKNILVVHNEIIADKSFTKIIYPELQAFTVVIEESREDYDEVFCSAMKMMIDYQKESKE